jgi:flagellar motility protein MotE (MotC chaperone)
VIVTRRRRKPFPWKRLILPVIAIGLVIFAFIWGPSRSVITGGPLQPLMQNLGDRFATIAAPFHFAAQNEVITDRNKQIMQEESQIADLQTQIAAKDKQISSLNSQISELQTQAANSRGAAPAASAAPVAAAAAAGAANPVTQSGGGDLSAGATQDMRRTAQVWSNMDPSNAAKVIQQLPIPYVARVLALMSPDDAGAILDAAPATFVAQVTQENPQLKR